jgi:type I restriction enzyme, S subunit
MIASPPPEDWYLKRLTDITSLITCGLASTPTYVDSDSGVPFLSAQNVRDGQLVLEKYRYVSLELHRDLTKKNKPQYGDILYSRVGAGFGDAALITTEMDFSVYVSLTLIKVNDLCLNT